VPTVQPPAPPAEPVRAEPALAVDGRARVVKTAGRGVVLHAEPRRGARLPAGLLEGAPVTLLELAGEEWARVRSPQGQVGWVPTAYLVPAD
jgi:Bacterial SH3 domain